MITKERRSSKVPHSKRPPIRGAAHVVLRVTKGLPWLRAPRTYRALERAFRNGKEKDGFGLIEYSVQQDHLHLIVEADDRRRLARGMQGLMIRIAKALNRFWRDRVGRVFADRYFALAITQRVQLRRVLRYVLQNGRKHGVWSEPNQPHPYSSGRWFLRWCTLDSFRRPLRARPVVLPRTFELLALRALALESYRDRAVIRMTRHWLHSSPRTRSSPRTLISQPADAGGHL